MPEKSRRELRWDRIHNELANTELLDTVDPDSMKYFEEYIRFMEGIATKAFSFKEGERTMPSTYENHLDGLVDTAIRLRNPVAAAFTDMRASKTPEKWISVSSRLYAEYAYNENPEMSDETLNESVRDWSAEMRLERGRLYDELKNAHWDFAIRQGRKEVENAEKEHMLAERELPEVESASSEVNLSLDI